MHVDVNGTGVEFSDEGDGRPVVLLHGFPDTGTLWRNQVPALRDAGYRVIVPDLRGYGGTDKPTDVEQYAIPYLAGDVIGLLDHLGIERAHVVGHDWGSALAWAIAAFAPDRVDHLVALSVGHPGAFRDAGLLQREKSWYMLLFQFAGIAEAWLSNDGWANFREWSHYPDADRVIAELERDQSLTPGLNWYRANIPPESYVTPGIEVPPVKAPTMGVWSDGDMALLEEQMTASSKFVEGTWRYERVNGAGHWMQLERPDAVNRLLLDYLPV
jgi:pimeloyl-ACP methyl ester carboxylesterase